MIRGPGWRVVSRSRGTARCRSRRTAARHGEHGVDAHLVGAGSFHDFARAGAVHLNISDGEWGLMAGEFKKSLDKFEVPAAEQQELFDIVGKTKTDIVTRP
jgi:hypothetical protein